MPIRLPDRLPAIDLLKQENIFVMGTARATAQDIRPLRIVVLNLMPIKITTETDLVRVLSNTPLQLDLTFMKIRSHTSKNTPIEHMRAFYRDFEVLRHEKFDGMIITGAPVEQLDFEQVTYWQEMTDIFDWARTHVTSTLYICWAAQAGLYYHYGVPKYPLPAKMFGIFPQHTLQPRLPIFRGFDDVFQMPHSRHTEIQRKDVEKVEALTILAESPESGVSIVMAREGREFFITGHLEYSPLTLDTEYRRDLVKGQSGRLLCGYIYACAGDGESTTDVVFSGHDIIAENGTVLAESTLFENGIIYADIDLMSIASHRRKNTSFRTDSEYNGFYSSFGFEKRNNTDLIRFIDPHPFVPSDESRRDYRCKLIMDIQAAGLKKRIEHIGAENIVLGISGGLDSTLALLISARAFEQLGRD